MEVLVGSQVWQGRRVLVTGHTGFKGGWLSLWLNQMGATVTGFALPPSTNPSFFDQVGLAKLVEHFEGDVRNAAAVEAVVAQCQPEVVFHLAAQPLVRLSYHEPIETFATNIMGTAHVLDACRTVQGVKAAVCITTDKCYENREWVWPYRETDPLGGHDPYSSSKGAAELIIESYRRSFFQTEGTAIASVRAGNVIGGGDWSPDRLIPDIVRAMLAGKRPLIRSPGSVRPWQHVLEALGGYLMIAERLLGGDRSVATAYNFGPYEDDARPVSFVAEKLLNSWGATGWDLPSVENQLHEANLLRLDCSKARAELGWRPTLGLEQALVQVAEWYKQVNGGADARTVSLGQLKSYQASSKPAPHAGQQYRDISQADNAMSQP